MVLLEFGPLLLKKKSSRSHKKAAGQKKVRAHHEYIFILVHNHTLTT